MRGTDVGVRLACFSEPRVSLTLTLARALTLAWAMNLAFTLTPTPCPRAWTSTSLVPQPFT